MDPTKAAGPRPPELTQELRGDPVRCARIWSQYASEAERFGDIEGAFSGHMSAWKLQPQALSFYEPLRQFLERQYQVDALIQVLELGSRLFPKQLATWVSYSRWLNHQGEFAAGKQAAERALELDATCIEAQGNLGNALRGLGEYAAAASCFETILVEQPEQPLARFNLACVQLAMERWQAGLANYEARLLLPGYERLRSRNASPRWRGESLVGKRLLVYAEQGLGDTFMLARYIPMLVELGATDIVVEVQPAIAWILKSTPFERVQWIERQDLDRPLDLDTDFQIPLLSLLQVALRHHSNLASTPAAWLQAITVETPRARQLLAALPERTPRVGLCWQGNPNAAIDRGRSLALESLYPLWQVSGVQWVSLQSRVGLEGLDALVGQHAHLHALPDLDGAGRAFEETLCLLQSLDLVITTDTAIAHLAGVLGKPCWILLQRFPEWRWGLEEGKTHWYPQARLFRQPLPGDWSSVLAEVVEALRLKTQVHRPS